MSAFDESWEPRAARAAGSLFGPYGDVRFLEGGDRGDEGRGRIGRYVRVDTDHGSTFHTCLVLAEMPSTWTFPGGAEFLAYLESAAEHGAQGDVIEADVCVRIRRTSNTDALRKVRRKRSKLAWQRGEYAGNVTGVPGSLGASADALNEMQTTLEANRAEPELLLHGDRPSRRHVAAPPGASRHLAAGPVRTGQLRAGAPDRRTAAAAVDDDPWVADDAAGRPTSPSTCWPATWRRACRCAATASVTTVAGCWARCSTRAATSR